MFKIFIIILNWNRAYETIECLKSIQKLKIKDFLLEVVVVDNASKDGMIEIIRKNVRSITGIRGIRGKIIENKENLGFAGGNNVGIKYALENKADFVLILNNDTIVDKNLIIGLLETAKKYPKAGAISPKIYFAKGYEFHKDRYKDQELGKVIWYAGGKVDWKNVYGTNRGVDEVDKGQYEETEETDFATGACMFLNTKALREVGFFDEKYFMYFEDVDLSQRMKKAGWKVFYTPYAYLWHKVARSSSVGGNLNDYYITRNRMLFGLRYAPVRTYLALIRESIKLLATGRKWQRIGILSFYLKNFGKGGYNEESKIQN